METVYFPVLCYPGEDRKAVAAVGVVSRYRDECVADLCLQIGDDPLRTGYVFAYDPLNGCRIVLAVTGSPGSYSDPWGSAAVKAKIKEVWNELYVSLADGLNPVKSKAGVS